MGTVSERRIHGIDFSGGTNAAEDIWITTGEVVDDQLEVHKCRSAAKQFGTSSRCATLKTLHEFIADHEQSVFGLDFSFSVPASVTDKERWLEVVESISGHSSAKEMQDSYSERARASDYDGVHLKRTTDNDRNALSPYGFITFRQTFYGVKHVLKPLLDKDLVSVLPMQKRDSTRPWVFEVYPASTLRRLGSFDSGYKKQTVESRHRRAQNVDDLRDSEVEITDKAAQHARYIDDALDSLVAAFATFRTVRDGPPAVDEASHPEGHIYV